MDNSLKKHLVVFKMEQEEYAVPISFIREIIKPMEIIQIPQSPDFVEGIIHLRNNIIPVIDLGKRLGASPEDPCSKKQKIILVEIQEKIVGIIVDNVGEVIHVSESNISAVPETISTVDTRYLDGVIRIEDRVILLMNIEKVLNKEEMKVLIEQH